MENLKLKTLLYGLACAVWTLIVGYLVLTPSEGSIANDLSRLIGDSELTDAVGHGNLH